MWNKKNKRKVNKENKVLRHKDAKKKKKKNEPIFTEWASGNIRMPLRWHGEYGSNGSKCIYRKLIWGVHCFSLIYLCILTLINPRNSNVKYSSKNDGFAK